MNDDAITLHREAMGLVDQALLLRREGKDEQSDELFHAAFAKEEAAARLLTDQTSLEPTRSVLFRSAASLALDCGKTREAEKLIAVALAGEPPDVIAGELRDLLESVNFQRHLDLRGIRLHSNEFQLSLEGNSVGLGIAPAEDFVTRVKDLEKLIYRTAERAIGQSFREAGRAAKALRDKLELYVSVPRPGSLAVTFKLGGPTQLSFEGIESESIDPMAVVDEIFECVDLFTRNDMDSLQRRIPDESYYHNFLGLIRKMAPDGDHISSVGFTTIRQGIERSVALRMPALQPRVPTVSPGVQKEELIEIRGKLLEANAKNAKAGKIQLIDQDGKTQRIKVPRGMMSDIVKPMFEEEVVVQGCRLGTGILLNSIDLIDQ